ncbi:MAG: DUF3524 domain-containing protein [Planctomycetes bacterium]|nr:DUF3524 domain-containing protein [Planctomycetota bacterium]
MKILALEPYFGGSHKAFLDGWVGASRHEFTVLTLPPHSWKWRMRAGGAIFADKLKQLEDNRFDVIFCSDMLNLAEFKGLLPPNLAAIPTVVYFHENQLTYPFRFESERDYQFVLTNTTTALAADAVWFNSAFHRDEFLYELRKFLKRMPGNELNGAPAAIGTKCSIHPPGIDPLPVKSKRAPGPARILWAARWEHDKNPEDFFAAINILKTKGLDFRISVIGEQFKDIPEVFDSAKTEFADTIDRWGYQEDREDYINALCESDIFVSTANHEFFGISVVEAIAAGAYPLLPERLSYPQIIANIETDRPGEFFYDGTVKQLANKLYDLIKRAQDGKLWADENIGVAAIKKFYWPTLSKTMDDAIESSATN